MIGKIHGHNSVKKAIEYNLKHDSELIDTHNMTVEGPREVTDAMLLVQQAFTGRATQKTLHVILSPSIEDGKKLTLEQWQDIANSYLRKMNLEERQSAVFLHEDKGHKHLHLVVNRIDHWGTIWRATDAIGKDIDKVKLTWRAADEIAQEMGLVRAQQVQERAKAIEPSKKIIAEPQGVKQEVEKILQQASRAAWHVGRFNQGEYLEAIRQGLEKDGKGRTLQTAHVDKDPAKAIRGYEIVMPDGKRISASTIGREYTLQQQAKRPLVEHWKEMAHDYLPSIGSRAKQTGPKKIKPVFEAGNIGTIKLILTQSRGEALQSKTNGKDFREAFEKVATIKLLERGYEFHPYRKDKADQSKLTGYGIKYVEKGEGKYISATALGREYTLPRLEAPDKNKLQKDMMPKLSTMEEERTKLKKEVRQTIGEIIKEGGRANSLVERLQAKGHLVTELYDPDGNVTDYRIKTKKFVGLTGAQLSPDLRDNNIEMTIALTYAQHGKGLPAYIQNFQNQGYTVAISEGNGLEIRGYELTRGEEKKYIPLTQAVYQERQLSNGQKEGIEHLRIWLEQQAQEKKRKEKQEAQQTREHAIPVQKGKEPNLVIKHYDKASNQQKTVEVPVRTQQAMAGDLSQLRYENPLQWKAAIEFIKDGQGKQKYSVEMNTAGTDYALTDLAEGHRLTAIQIGQEWGMGQLALLRQEQPTGSRESKPQKKGETKTTEEITWIKIQEAPAGSMVQEAYKIAVKNGAKKLGINPHGEITHYQSRGFMQGEIEQAMRTETATKITLKDQSVLIIAETEILKGNYLGMGSRLVAYGIATVEIGTGKTKGYPMFMAPDKPKLMFKIHSNNLLVALGSVDFSKWKDKPLEEFLSQSHKIRNVHLKSGQDGSVWLEQKQSDGTTAVARVKDLAASARQAIEQHQEKIQPPMEQEIKRSRGIRF